MLPSFIISLITNINESGLHPIESFMCLMLHIYFMKSGKSLAISWVQGLSRSKLEAVDRFCSVDTQWIFSWLCTRF
jgi:hypothetical protein